MSSTKQLLLALAVCVCASCTGGSSTATSTPTRTTAPPEGRLSGVLSVSAMHSYPVAGTVIIEGFVSRRIAVSKNGRFNVGLPPGDYRLTGRSPVYNDGKGVCTAYGPQMADSGKVSIVSGETARIKVLCVER